MFAPDEVFLASSNIGRPVSSLVAGIFAHLQQCFQLEKQRVYAKIP
jgi:hypothetical protein